MSIKDNPNLVLTITMHADDESELVWMLKEVSKQVKSGAIAGNGGGCACSYIYKVNKGISFGKDKEMP